MAALDNQYVEVGAAGANPDYAFPSLDDERTYAACSGHAEPGAVEPMYSSQPPASFSSVPASRQSAASDGMYEYGTAAQARESTATLQRNADARGGGIAALDSKFC